MPNRIIGGGICASDTLQALADNAEAEVLFYRLLVVADDFGRFDGRLAVIRAACFPLRTETTLTQKIGHWLTALERVRLIRRYEVDGKPYLLINKWEQHQRIRAVRAKYPDPPQNFPPNSQQSAASGGDPPQSAAIGGDLLQPAASCGDSRLARAGTHSHSQSYSHAQSYSHTEKNKDTAAAPPGVQQDVWDAWLRQKGRKQTADADRLQRKHLAEWLEQGQDVNAIVERSVASRWQGLQPQRAPPRQSNRADKRATNLELLTGQGDQKRERFAGTAERVDQPSVPALPSDIRESDDANVGGCGPRRSAAHMG